MPFSDGEIQWKIDVVDSLPFSENEAECEMEEEAERKQGYRADTIGIRRDGEGIPHAHGKLLSCAAGQQQVYSQLRAKTESMEYFYCFVPCMV